MSQPRQPLAHLNDSRFATTNPELRRCFRVPHLPAVAASDDDIPRSSRGAIRLNHLRQRLRGNRLCVLTLRKLRERISDNPVHNAVLISQPDKLLRRSDHPILRKEPRIDPAIELEIAVRSRFETFLRRVESPCEVSKLRKRVVQPLVDEVFPFERVDMQYRLRIR